MLWELFVKKQYITILHSNNNLTAGILLAVSNTMGFIQSMTVAVPVHGRITTLHNVTWFYFLPSEAKDPYQVITGRNDSTFLPIPPPSTWSRQSHRMWGQGGSPPQMPDQKGVSWKWTSTTDAQTCSVGAVSEPDSPYWLLQKVTTATVVSWTCIFLRICWRFTLAPSPPPWIQKPWLWGNHVSVPLHPQHPLTLLKVLLRRSVPCFYRSL